MKKQITDPNKLFDAIMAECGIRTDAELSRSLGMSPANICNMRKRRVQIGPITVIRIMESAGMSLMRIHALLGEKVW